MQIKFYLFNDGAEKFMNFLKYFLVQWALLFCGRCVWGLPLIYVGVERGPPSPPSPPPPNEWNGWLAAFNLKEEKNGHNRISGTARTLFTVLFTPGMSQKNVLSQFGRTTTLLVLIRLISNKRSWPIGQAMCLCFLQKKTVLNSYLKNWTSSIVLVKKTFLKWQIFYSL